MIKDKENKFKRLLNGKWIESTNYIDIKSPLTGEVIGKIPAMRQEEVNEAIEGIKKLKVGNPLEIDADIVPLIIIRVKDMEKTIEIANKSEYDLQLS